MSTITYAIWALAAGALVPMMAALMAGLAHESGGAIQALVLMLVTGLIAALLLAAIAGAHIPTIRTLVHIAPYRYAGGLIVGFYILSITFLAPRFGVGNAILFAFTAQLITAAFIDHFALGRGRSATIDDDASEWTVYRCCRRNHHAGRRPHGCRCSK